MRPGANDKLLSYLILLEEKDNELKQYIDHFKALLARDSYDHKEEQKTLSEMRRIFDNTNLVDGQQNNLQKSLIKLKLLYFFSIRTGEKKHPYRNTVFTEQLDRLINETQLVVSRDASKYYDLDKAVRATVKMLMGDREMSMDDYHKIAAYQHGHPSLGMQVIGGLMLGLATLVMAAGAASLIGWVPALVLGGTLAAIGLYKINQGKPRSVAASMFELAKLKGYDKHCVDSGNQTELFPEDTKGLDTSTVSI